MLFWQFGAKISKINSATMYSHHRKKLGPQSTIEVGSFVYVGYAERAEGCICVNFKDDNNFSNKTARVSLK